MRGILWSPWNHITYTWLCKRSVLIKWVLSHWGRVGTWSKKKAVIGHQHNKNKVYITRYIFFCGLEIFSKWKYNTNIHQYLKQKVKEFLPYYIINIVPVYAFKSFCRKPHSNNVWINIWVLKLRKYATMQITCTHFKTLADWNTQQCKLHVHVLKH